MLFCLLALANRIQIPHELPDGLGTDVKTLKNLCRDNPAALDALDRATQGRTGRPSAETVDNINDLKKPDGTSRDAALRRLRKHSDPESDDYREDVAGLYRQVLQGEKSCHRAMIEAGFRKQATSREMTIKSFKKCENRLEVLREILALLEEHETEWLKEQLG